MTGSKTATPAKDERPAPTERQSEAARRAAERYRKRTPPPEYQPPAPGATKLNWRGLHNDDAGHVLQVLDTFGTASTEFAQHGVGRVATAMRAHGNAMPDSQELNAGLAAVAGIAPENETEAMLAIQMIATHECAMDMLGRAKQASTYEKMETCGTLASKLLRTFTQQIEALAKIRRGGSQKVVVEHVHVYPGGQAIVGRVDAGHGGGGGNLENRHQPHATGTTLGKPALATAQGTALLRENAEREGMPVASSGRKKALPDARRSRRQRRTQG